MQWVTTCTGVYVTCYAKTKRRGEGGENGVVGADRIDICLTADRARLKEPFMPVVVVDLILAEEPFYRYKNLVQFLIVL